MRLLNRSATAKALSHAQCVEALDPAMRAVSNGGAIMPLRQYLSIPGERGKFTLMPGYCNNPEAFGVKIVSKYPREHDSPHGSHVGAVMVFDAAQGIPLGMLEGAELTAIRTAAASALATRVLAREDSQVLTVLGTGTEALHHVKAILTVRPITSIRVWGRNPQHAQELVSRLALPNSVEAVNDIQQALSGADIVCTTTAATDPILKGEWLEPGTHVNLVGAAVKSAAEADAEVVVRSRFYTDSITSALDQAGELNAAMSAGLVDDTHIVAEIGAVLDKPELGRQSDDQITVYKSLGVAAQDLAAGLAALNNASENDIGVEIPWND